MLGIPPPGLAAPLGHLVVFLLKPFFQKEPQVVLLLGLRSKGRRALQGYLSGAVPNPVYSTHKDQRSVTYPDMHYGMRLV